MKFLLSSISILMLSTLFAFAPINNAQAQKHECSSCAPNKYEDGVCYQTNWELFMYRAWKPNKNCNAGLKYVCSDHCGLPDGNTATCVVNGESIRVACEQITDYNHSSLPSKNRFAQSIPSELLFALASYEQSSGDIAQCLPSSELSSVSGVSL